MKKILLSFCVVLFSLILLISCGCKHEWKDATCTEPQTCTKCGKTQGKALGHEWEFVCQEKAPTCSEKGEEIYSCNICGETKVKELAKLSHQYKDGYCIVCFAEDKNFNFNPSDEEKEQIEKVKSIGDRKIRAEDDFYYLLFSFSDKDSNTVVAPCVVDMRIENDKGETVYRAKRIVGTDDYSTWSNAYRKWILASPKIMRSDIKEGSSSNGTLYFTVEFVDTYFKEYGLEISNLPMHTFGEEVILEEATCGTEGLIEKICSSCGQVVVETIPATGRHTYKQGTIVKEATCSRKGEMEYTCVVCGVVGRTEIIDELDHSFVNDKCTTCGTLKIGSKGPAGGFVFYDCDLDNENGNSDGLVSTECGWRFLETTPGDIGVMVFGYYRHSSNGENLCVNGDVEYYENNCTRPEIGYGKSNTEMLVEAMGNETYVYSGGAEKTTVYAAKACLDYSLNGYNDWFLPSRDELSIMYTNLFGSGYWGKDECWSSSEVGSRTAFCQDFFYGSQWKDERSEKNTVRPIRAFL